MIVISSLGATVAALPASQTERMITHAPRSHILTNANVWSPDGEWIVYDVRSGRGFDGLRIERVNVRTGEVQNPHLSGYAAKKQIPINMGGNLAIITARTQITFDPIKVTIYSRKHLVTFYALLRRSFSMDIRVT